MPEPAQIVVVSQELARARQLGRGIEALAGADKAAVALTSVTPLEARRGAGATRAAFGRADVIIVSHVLVDEDAEAVLSALDAYARPDAQLLVLNSLRPLMLKTRLGGLAFASALRSGELPPMFALFDRILSDPDATGAIREVRERLPELLERTPQGAGDLRAYLHAAIAWMDPTPRNMGSLLLLLADRYGPAKGVFAGRYAAPRTEPLTGLYHPSIGITDSLAAVRAARAARPHRGAVGILLVRGAVLSGDHAVHDALIAAVEARGFEAVPIFSDSFDFRAAIDRFVVPAGAFAVLNPSTFPLVGGHNRSDAPAVAAFLAERNLLYLTPSGLMVQDIAQWERSGLGLLPIETAMQPAIHELEGGIETLLVHGTKDGERAPLGERTVRLVDRLDRWARLREKPNAEKKILLVIFAFPPGKGAVGTAAYLDVARSACTILKRLQDEGYAVVVPESPEALLESIVLSADKAAPISSVGLAVGARLGVPQYEKAAPSSRRAERLWGHPPGTLNSDGRDLLIHGVRLGNAFVGVQPSFGYEGDPMRLLFEKNATPHHGFIGFYAWAETTFGADAVVQIGTHGALEFMPGKQVGLSSQCWPDILAGTIPNIYLYALNNPAEGTIAKRRGYALTIGHLTPPAEAAGLYRGLAELKALIGEYRGADDGPRRARTFEVVLEKAREMNLAFDADPTEPMATIGRLASELAEIEARRIPIGLHAIGERPRPEERIELLAAMGEYERPEDELRSALALLIEARGEDAAAIEARVRAGDVLAVDLYESARALWRDIVATLVLEGAEAAKSRAAYPLGSLLAPNAAIHAVIDCLAAANQALDASDELTPLVRALGGGYVPPGAGGDPARSPGVLPSGRNIHALDPAHVPSAAAMRQAKVVVDMIVRRRRAELGRWPEAIGLVLWGLDNIKTHGEAIAQAFHLLGVRPAKNSIGRTTRLEVVSLEELGRPRIDVLMTVSGIFRDIFGSQMELLDQAVRLVASLDEPPEMNFVRARCQALEAAGSSAADAASRLFSNAAGQYGAHVDHMVQMSLWQERDDLADIYLKRKSFAFVRGGEFKEAPELFARLAGALDTTVQNLDSSEVSIIDVDHYFEYLGGLTALVEKESGVRPSVLVADTTAASPRLRTLEETVRLETRTKLLNPKWYEGMLAHGYEGVEEIKKRLDYTFGWSATCEAVDAWIYDEATAVYLEDPAVRERLQEKNVHAFAAMVSRLGEAADRGFWAPSAEQRRLLDRLTDEAEDAIEGVT